MKTVRTILAEFQHYLRQPQYVQPLQETPGNRSIAIAHQFMAEYPLFLGAAILSVGMLTLTSYLTGRDVIQLLNKPISTDGSDYGGFAGTYVIGSYIPSCSKPNAQAAGKSAGVFAALANG